MICDSKIQGNALYSLHPTMLFALPVIKNTKKSSGYCFRARSLNFLSYEFLLSLHL